MPNHDHVCPGCGDGGSYLDFPDANTTLNALYNGLGYLKQAQECFLGTGAAVAHGLTGRAIVDVEQEIANEEAGQAGAKRLRCPDEECGYVGPQEEFFDESYYS